MTYHPSKCALNYNFAAANDEISVHTLLWSIPKFLTIVKCTYIEVVETEYMDNIKQENQFKLRIQFCGINRDLVEIYYLYPENIKLNEATSTIFRDNANYKNETLIKRNNCTVTGNKWQLLLSLTRDNLTNAYNLPKGVLKLQFQFTVSPIVSDDIKCDTIIPKNQLSNNFENLLQNTMFADVIMKSAEGFEFKVHKCILSSRSTVLNAFFAHESLEKKKNIIDSHLNTEVLKEVLTYIYTDRALRVQEMPDKILEAADFYNLPELKKISEEILHLELTADNAINTLQLADLYSATSLKQLTLEFIKDGNTELVIKSDGWKSFNSTHIIKNLYEFVVDTKKE